MKLFYNHEKRQIVDENGKEYAPGKAIELYDQGEVEDCNVAFLTLAGFQGDFNKVEEFYKSS